MKSLTLAQWQDGIVVVAMIGPAQQSTAYCCCPICQWHFDGIPVGPDEDAAILKARQAFTAHIMTAHPDAILRSARL